ncbi:hypothetical protein [Mammaliicoccus sciuri]|uniref:hypothetical protein n=1 Tax=Mammaliicoccus sciuri TaxID=1296 RepID=UPI000D1F6C99|nr:hypothetical protein [Mammaliicoccus sciuri]MCC2090302.1 hypothetical protein [Mammaliicoccus sciuri]MCD8898335.1 hypothetical protein [Mammaliicoccus sciuri]MEB5568389.1 hypothetical protein [Mammaliicoccus sciuri]PTJ71409.1 hypothetical protein BU008_08315 [Mammaliicoccus sciuri]
MAQVEIKTYEGNKLVTENVEIKEMNILQIKRVSRELNKLVKDINTNDHLKSAVDTFFAKRNEINEENRRLYEEALEKAKSDDDKVNVFQYDGSEAFKRAGAQFFKDVLGSFEIVLENAPDSLQNLISQASNINADVIGQQNVYTFLDIIDAVIEVNDIPKLIERLKKSKDSFSMVLAVLFPKKEQTTDEVMPATSN